MLTPKYGGLAKMTDVMFDKITVFKITLILTSTEMASDKGS
jgi:hypothetical protein